MHSSLGYGPCLKGVLFSIIATFLEVWNYPQITSWKKKVEKKVFLGSEGGEGSNIFLGSADQFLSSCWFVDVIKISILLANNKNYQ